MLLTIKNTIKIYLTSHVNVGFDNEFHFNNNFSNNRASELVQSWIYPKLQQFHCLFTSIQLHYRPALVNLLFSRNRNISAVVVDCKKWFLKYHCIDNCEHSIINNTYNLWMTWLVLLLLQTCGCSVNIHFNDFLWPVNFLIYKLNGIRLLIVRFHI